MSTTYQATVASPCSGSQTLPEINSTTWSGPTGSFTLATLAIGPTTCYLTIIDVNPSSSCFPSKTYAQVTPNTSDPSGQYGLLVGGSPDTSAGSASITVL